jgi:hypothetical protein
MPFSLSLWARIFRSAPPHFIAPKERVAAAAAMRRACCTAPGPSRRHTTPTHFHIRPLRSCAHCTRTSGVLPCAAVCRPPCPCPPRGGALCCRLKSAREQCSAAGAELCAPTPKADAHPPAKHGETHRRRTAPTGLSKSNPALGDFVLRSFSITSSDQLVFLAPAYSSNKSLSAAVCLMLVLMIVRPKACVFARSQVCAALPL